MDEESFTTKSPRSDWLFIEPHSQITDNGDEIGIVLIETPNGIYSLSVLCSIKQNEVTCYFDEVEMNTESIDRWRYNERNESNERVVGIC
jgi:hypothetical protein